MADEIVAIHNQLQKLDYMELATMLGGMRMQYENIDFVFDSINTIRHQLEEIEGHYTSGMKERAELWYSLVELLDDVDEFAEEDERPCSVYYILNEEKDKVKIGISYNPLGRAKNIQTSSGEEIELLHVIEFPTRSRALNAEAFLHKEFMFYRKKPSKVAKSCEWFDACIVDDLKKLYWTQENIERLNSWKFEKMREHLSQVNFH